MSGPKNNRGSFKHGLYRDPLYYIHWTHMKARVMNTNHVAYPRYGGRGVMIWPLWLDPKKFCDDLRSLYEEAKKSCFLDELVLGRIDHDGHYEPGNVKFLPREENATDNRRRGTVGRAKQLGRANPTFTNTL